MCSVIGALVWGIDSAERMGKANSILSFILESSHERGRDGRGLMINDGSNDPGVIIWKATTRVENGTLLKIPTMIPYGNSSVILGNLRAEPTTEYVQDKRSVDQQPYRVSPWAIVHNGTIANDKDIRTNEYPTKIDSAAIAEHLASSQYDIENPESVFNHFHTKIKELKGSYAILANCEPENNHILVAVNYRPVWWIQTDVGIFFASSRNYFPDEFVPKMVAPYSVGSFRWTGDSLEVVFRSLYPIIKNHRALVICSGGLDSTVAATYSKKVLGYYTELIHFCYGSRAEGPEVSAVKEIAKTLDIKATIFPIPIYKPSDSPLLQSDSKIAGGEEGAEFAYEWVPARNLVMLSVATAFAEANKFDTVILGNNLEEAGAYPDNEPEFIVKFNDLLPFAVGDGVPMQVLMPVGNLMKHEIVALGHHIGAPLDKTWSCYRAGSKHCGTCGPCYMRRTAFQINKLPEVISYLND